MGVDSERRGESWWTESDAEEWSDAIVAAMKLGGVDNLFFVSGSELTFYQEAIAKAHATGRPAPKLVTMTHEFVALNAALGNAMVRNQPAATAVHVDVGTLHSGAAIHTAWRGGYPVLMTAGTGPRAFPGSMRGARESPVQWEQEPRDQGEIVRQYTKLDHRLEYQDNPGLMVSRLLQVAMSNPMGPVYLSIPQEIAKLPMQGTSFPTRDQLGLARPVWPDPDDVKTIARWLVKADNPLICTGSSGREPEAVDSLIALSELLAIPIAETRHSDRMNFPANHWAYGTGPAPRNADAILVLEDMVPFVPGANGPSIDTKIAWVSLDPVLSRYTTREFRADLWIPASSSATARAIYEAATALLKDSDLSRIAQRRERLQTNKVTLAAKINDIAAKDMNKGELTGNVVGYELAKLLEPDSILLNDGVSNNAPIKDHSQRSQPGTYFRSHSSSGGWGSGASIGVKLARPNQDVLLATGDGYFLFGAPSAALWAADYHDAPYLSIVFVNGSYSTGTTALRQAYPDGFAVRNSEYAGGSFDPTPDFAKLAEASNSYGENVTDIDQVGPALQRGLEHTRNGTPAVIAVHVPEEQ